ncbi:MAG TPA: hypothetical protein VNR42_01000 [Solirubrobacteraceae bacterium]|nr:hypothetical protein [Solirubrobacteraceae bacterium]
MPSDIAVPAPSASARNGSTLVTPELLSTTSPPATAALSSSEMPNTSLRGKRSASCPAGSASTNIGMNSARPIQPRSRALRWKL